MSQDFTDKNGKIHRFPDGTKKEVISKVMGPDYSVAKKSDDSVMEILGKFSRGANNIYKSIVRPEHLIKAGLMGMGQGAENIGELAAPLRKYIPESMKFSPKPDFNLPKDSNVLEKIVHGAGQYSPLLATGPLGFLADTATGAAYGATQSPDDKLTGSAVGGSSNAGFNILGQMIKSKNPWVKMAAKALFGGGIGYAEGGPEGSVEGAALSTLGPKLLKKAGIIGNPAEEIMSRISPEEAITRAEAGKRLGTPLTPGEATARPDITGLEATIGQSGEAAPERVKIGQQRIADQKAAIEELGRTISPSTKIASFDTRKAAKNSIEKMEDIRQEAADPFYKKAETQSVDPSIVSELENSDPTIRTAISDAMSDPKYQVEGELLGVPKNRIKVLDYAKRNIDAKISQAIQAGDKDAARVLMNSKNKLLNKMDSISDDYREARRVYGELSKPIEEVENSQIGRIANMKDTQLKNVSKNIFDPSQTDLNVFRKIKDHIIQQNPEAWDSIVKNEIDRLMTQGRNNGITGRAFFDKVLSNDNRFKQFQVALEHNPESLKQLDDMKTAWEHLINIETPRTSAGHSKSHVNMWRSSVEAIIGIYNNLMGGKNQIKALKYLYSDKWMSDIEKVKKMPKKDQKPMMIMLMGKTIAPAYTLENEHNTKKKGE